MCQFSVKSKVKQFNILQRQHVGHLYIFYLSCSSPLLYACFENIRSPITPKLTQNYFFQFEARAMRHPNDTENISNSFEKCKL